MQNPSTVTDCPNVIDGKKIRGSSDRGVTQTNPADTRINVSQRWDSTREDAFDAVATAEGAFPFWAATPAPARAEIIRRATELMAGKLHELSMAMVAEIGKTRVGARNEVKKTIKIGNFMAGLGSQPSGYVVEPWQPGVSMYTRRVPLGVVCLITPFNFPLAVSWWKIAPAIIAGNTVVWKPSPFAPITSCMIMDLLTEAGLPPGVVNLVHGGPAVGEAFVKNPAVEAVSFTGSTKIGRQIAVDAIMRGLDPGKILCEMGGQNAVVVRPSANLNAAAQAIVDGAFKGEGQRCTATSRAIIHSSVYEQMLGLISDKTSTLVVGPGTDPKSQVGPLVCKHARDSAVSKIDDAFMNGGMGVLCGGNRLTGDIHEHGCFMEPTILTGDPTNPDHTLFHEEVFGPVLAVCRGDNMDTVLRLVNSTDHRHVASIFTGELREALDFVDGANVGMVHVNNFTFGGDEHAGFGGLGGATSFGPKEMGPDCLDFFTRPKTVDINYGDAPAPGR